jgi:hypothetical protein
MYLDPQTKFAQSSLAAYCRTGVLNDIPGIDDDHIKHYRRLVYNIINDSLQSAYPITYQFLGDEKWSLLVDEFFSNHPCQSPQVWWMPREFYEYLLEVKHPLIVKYDFLPDLLQMEWLEVELFMMEDQIVSFENKPKSTRNKLVLNPEYRLIHFSYPVHLKKTSGISPSDKSDYFLVMHREPEIGRILFTDVSLFFARMIENLEQEPLSFDGLVQLTAGEFGIEANDQVFMESKAFISKAINNKLILGNIQKILISR